MGDINVWRASLEYSAVYIISRFAHLSIPPHASHGSQTKTQRLFCV